MWNYYHFLNSSYSRLVVLSLPRSKASASTIDEFFAAWNISSLFGTMIAPRRRWSWTEDVNQQWKVINQVKKWKWYMYLNKETTCKSHKQLCGKNGVQLAWPMTTICWIRVLLMAASSISKGSTFSPIFSK